MVSFALLLIHTFFMITNTTTWEKFSRKNITYLRSIKDNSINPFNEGYCKNILLFFCYCDDVKWENAYVKFTNSNTVGKNNAENIAAEKTVPENDQIQIVYSSE